MIATIFDTETTGLVQNHTIKLDRQPEVIEFASISIDWDSLETVGEFECLIKPHIMITAEQMEKVPITPELLADAFRFPTMADKILPTLEKADIVVAHNLSFDMEMMDIECERMGRKLKWPKRRLCTVEQSIHHVGRRLNLGELHMELVGMAHTDAHRAMSDVRATTRCLIEMRKREWI